MRLAHTLALPLCWTVFACATPSEPVSSATPASLPEWKLASPSPGNSLQGTTANGTQLSLLVQGRSLTGPSASLDVSGGRVRGTGASGRSINVTITGNRAQGQVGSVLFSCIVEINADGSAHITGAMGAGNTDYVLSPKVLNGRVGVVTYNLTWTGAKYEGQMVPGGYGYLTLPAVMATWSDVEAATVLSILLMGS